MELSNILTLIFSSGALLFSFLNYNRGKRYENENFLYKTKVDVYTKVLCDLETLIRFLGQSIEDAKEYIEEPTKENRKMLDNLAVEVDEICYEFNNYITGHSLVIPENIVESLSIFCDKVLENEALDIQSNPTNSCIVDAEKVLDSLISDAENIGVELRKDLHINQLNLSLFRRLK